MSESRVHLVAPLTAAALIAQQVGSNAIRDGLFLSWFPVTALPYFVAGSALLAIPTAQGAGRLLVPLRSEPHGARARRPQRGAVPHRVGAAGAAAARGHGPPLPPLFRAGGIAISAFWSLLNERFDPHSAKALLARVAAAAAFGGFVGAWAPNASPRCSPRTRCSSRWRSPAPPPRPESCSSGSGRHRIVRPPKRRTPGAVGPRSGACPCCATSPCAVAFAAMLAALVDYVMKAEAVAYFGKGEPLVRFFGLFYAGTGFTAFLIQAALGRLALTRLGLAGSVASHPSGGRRGRGPGLRPPCSVARHPRRDRSTSRCAAPSFARATSCSYTPLPEATKRSAKSIVDVAWDCFGNAGGAALILVLTRLGAAHALVAVNVAAVMAAGAELLVARRLRAGSRRGSGGRTPAPERSRHLDASVRARRLHGRAEPRGAGSTGRRCSAPWPRPASKERPDGPNPHPPIR